MSRLEGKGLLLVCLGVCSVGCLLTGCTAAEAGAPKTEDPCLLGSQFPPHPRSESP